MPGRPIRRLGLDGRRAASSPSATLCRGGLGLRLPARPRGPGREGAVADAARASIVLTETEIWPLFLERAARRGIPVALVNGRISERSFARYRLVARLPGADARSALARSRCSRRRTRAASRRSARRRSESGCFGNLKYDLPPPPPFADADAAVGGRRRPARPRRGLDRRRRGGARPRRLARPAPARPLLVLAPRRPERFDEVARLSNRAACASCAAPPRLSTLDPRLSARRLPPGLDRRARIGVPRAPRSPSSAAASSPPGGQSPIEAWAAGVAVLAGPHMENFREVAAQGEALGILDRARDSGGARAAASPRRSRAGRDARDAAPTRPASSPRTAERPRRPRDALAAPCAGARGRARIRIVNAVSPLPALRQGAGAARRVVRLGAHRLARAAAALDLGRQPDLRRHRQDAPRRAPRAAPPLRGLAARDPLARLRPRVRAASSSCRPARARSSRPSEGGDEPVALARATSGSHRRRRRAARRGRPARGRPRRRSLPPRRRLPASRRRARRQPAALRRPRPVRRRNARRRAGGCASRSPRCAARTRSSSRASSAGAPAAEALAAIARTPPGRADLPRALPRRGAARRDGLPRRARGARGRRAAIAVCGVAERAAVRGDAARDVGSRPRRRSSFRDHQRYRERPHRPDPPGAPSAPARARRHDGEGRRQARGPDVPAAPDRASRRRDRRARLLPVPRRAPAAVGGPHGVTRRSRRPAPRSAARDRAELALFRAGDAALLARSRPAARRGARAAARPALPAPRRRRAAASSSRTSRARFPRRAPEEIAAIAPGLRRVGRRGVRRVPRRLEALRGCRSGTASAWSGEENLARRAGPRQGRLPPLGPHRRLGARRDPRRAARRADRSGRAAARQLRCSSGSSRGGARGSATGSIAKRDAARDILQAHARGETVAILVDQNVLRARGGLRPVLRAARPRRLPRSRSSS